MNGGDSSEPGARNNLDRLVDELGSGVILVGSSAKACRDAADLDLSSCHDSRRHPANTLDRTIAGREADLGSQLRWCVCACGRDVGGTFPDVVGTYLSRTIVVERDHPQEGP